MQRPPAARLRALPSGDGASPSGRSGGTGDAPHLGCRASLRDADLRARALRLGSPRTALAEVRRDRGEVSTTRTGAGGRRTARGGGVLAPSRARCSSENSDEEESPGRASGQSPPGAIAARGARGAARRGAVRGRAGRGPQQLRRCGEAPRARAIPLTATALRPQGCDEPPVSRTYWSAAGRRGLLVPAAGQTSPSFGRAAGRSACRAAPPSPTAARSLWVFLAADSEGRRGGQERRGAEGGGGGGGGGDGGGGGGEGGGASN